MGGLLPAGGTEAGATSPRSLCERGRLSFQVARTASLRLIDPTELAIDLQPADVRRGARYLDEVPAPSVIALNAVAVAEAVNRFMMGMTGLLTTDDPGYTIAFPRERETQIHAHRREATCRFCGDR